MLERIGHVFRMRNERLTKAIVLGWWEEMERWEKRPEKKRKMILHWKWILRETGIDWTDVERLTGDTEGWRKIAREKADHVERWDRLRGHRVEWGREGEKAIQMSVVRERDQVCRYEGCGKVCKNKGGLALHKKMMHRAAEQRVRFIFGRCGRGLDTEGAKVNHKRTCTVRGGRGGEDGVRKLLVLDYVGELQLH